MGETVGAIKLSLLDLLPTYGESQAVALTSVIAQAQLAEQLGFERYWLTEHHDWCGNSSPEILLPLIAATTRRIKVGMAGVLMHFHRSYKVARTFEVLENLFSGRIDLGICRGRVPAEVAPELRDAASGAPTLEEFANRAESLFNHLAQGAGQSGNSAQPWLLGFGSGTMELAAKLKISYCHSLTHAGAVCDPAILAAYHDGTRTDNAPHSAVLVGGICAPSAREADDLLSKHTNTFLMPTVVGTPGACADQLHTIAHQYRVQRIVWLDLSPSRMALHRSITLLAEAMALND
jgi:luciferase family oxidoreductase group 1